jgi:NADH-quinone oxidoreductase subunit N
MDFIILKSFIPEFFLVLCLLVQLLYNACLINKFSNSYPIITKEVFWQTAFILVCVLFLLLNLKCEAYFFNFLFVNDIGSIYIKILVVISCLFALVLIVQTFKLQSLNFFEYFILLLLAILALLLLISASDMLAAYLVIEMQALCFYVLASFRRDSAFSTEAGLKYFISGSFISAIFLCGCSIIYGLLGTLNFNHLSLLLSTSISDSSSFFYMFLLVGNLLIIITFLFKLAVVPFHFWAPDVYEGAPLASTIIFAVIPKLGIFYFFIKWLSITNTFFPEISLLLGFLGIASVIVGSLLALQQKRLKRLMIYSSIGQLGFLIAALSNLNVNTLVSIYFFLIIYIISSVLFWGYLTNFYLFQQNIRTFYSQSVSPLFLTSLANFSKINLSWSFALLIIIFSMAGLPPFSGFFAKFFVVLSLVEDLNLIVALILILVSIISGFYYLRFLKVLFFEPQVKFLSNSTSQVIFTNSFFLLNCFLNSFLLFLLVYIFFNPTFCYLVCHQIVIGSYFF